jgi:hypothetical protein
MDCPAGSECIIGPANAFASCCALGGSASMSVIVPMPQVSAANYQAGAAPNYQAGAAPKGANGGMTTDGTNYQGTSNQGTNNAGTTQKPEMKDMTDVSKPEMKDMTVSEEAAAVGADDTVRFLSIRLLEPSEGLAMWAPPNGTQPTSYTAEISYDGTDWKRLNLEEPDSTFIMFPVTEQKEFQIRVTPEGGAPMMESYKP